MSTGRTAASPPCCQQHCSHEHLNVCAGNRTASTEHIWNFASSAAQHIRTPFASLSCSEKRFWHLSWSLLHLTKSYMAADKTVHISCARCFAHVCRGFEWIFGHFVRLCGIISPDCCRTQQDQPYPSSRGILPCTTCLTAGSSTLPNSTPCSIQPHDATAIAANAAVVMSHFAQPLPGLDASILATIKHQTVLVLASSIDSSKKAFSVGRERHGVFSQNSRADASLSCLPRHGVLLEYICQRHLQP